MPSARVSFFQDRLAGWPPFTGTFCLWEAFQDPDDSRRRVNAWQDGVLRDAAKMRAAVGAGRTPKSGFRKVEVFGPEAFLSLFSGRPGGIY